MAEQEREYFSIKGMKVTNVREIGAENPTIFFSLTGKGLGLYNLRIVKGARGSFIASPQQKGKDGKYYDLYSLYLSNEDEERVMKAVIDKLPKKAASADTL